MDFAKSWERCDSIMRSLSICPAQAGVIPEIISLVDGVVNLSRASGGDPGQQADCVIFNQFVPRKRG